MSTTMNCRLVRRHMGAYVDSELDPATQIAFERHIECCVSCQERLVFEQDFQVRLRESVESPALPEGLMSRVKLTLDEADANVEQEPMVRFLPMRGRHVLPVAAAAALVLFAGVGLERSGLDSAVEETRASTIPLFDDVVRLHSSGLPSDVDDDRDATPLRENERARRMKQSVARYFRDKVEFPVRPAEFSERNVELVGARLSNVRDRRAAALFYDVGGHRLTVVVVDTPDVTNDVARVRLGDRDVFYRDVRGYTVPVRHHAGLTYAFTGDLDRQSLLRLAATARMR